MASNVIAYVFLPPILKAMSAIRSVLKSVTNLDVALSPVHDVPSEKAAPEYRVALGPFLV